MQKLSQLICLFAFLVLLATSCMAETSENEGEVDVHLRQVRATSISGCTQATITPAACGSNGCTITFYRTVTAHGITLRSGSSVYGFTGLTGLPGSVHFTHTRIFSNGTLYNNGGGFVYDVPIASITGITGANFFSTSGGSVSTNTPIGITGAITARSFISFGVAYVGGVNTVTYVEADNAGVLITQSRPGNGAITVNLCAPK